MIAKVNTCNILGLDVRDVIIEVDIRGGLPKLEIVGLPGKSIMEAKERVVSALISSGFDVPNAHIIVSLSPADLLKNSNGYDLPIALGILMASNQLNISLEKPQYFIGELSLAGELRHTNGILPISEHLKLKNAPIDFFIPYADKDEGSITQNIEIYAVNDIKSLVEHLQTDKIIPSLSKINLAEIITQEKYPNDFKVVKGQTHVKKALEIAAAGSHNVLMIGTPGSGKSLLAKSFPSILPPLTPEEILEVSKIYSVTGMLNRENPLILSRPFRSPHHTSSNVSLVGGGAYPKPGEISLAHRGVLFMDEFVEFSSNAIESLRQPLEDRVVTISRASGSLTYPANFSLIAAMNPCKCGWSGDKKRKCICTLLDKQRYTKKLSGPILDRFDLQVWVDRVEVGDLIEKSESESSESVRRRVVRAREIQNQRFKNLNISDKVKTNSDVGSAIIDEVIQIEKNLKDLIKAYVDKLNLSARSYYRLLKVSRTIADLDDSANIEQKHFIEATKYRYSEN